MMRKLMLLTVSMCLFLSCSLLLDPQERQARATVKQVFKQSPEGDSYDPMAWGKIEFDAPFAGTGTENPFWGETGAPPSAYSMTHRFRMRNGFGSIITFDVRFFFSDKNCTEWVGMEYMADDDPTRHLMK